MYRGTEGTDMQGACVSGGLKVRIYRVRVYRRNLRCGYTGCVCIGGSDGADIQGLCVSGQLKVRIYRVCVYRGD